MSSYVIYDLYMNFKLIYELNMDFIQKKILFGHKGYQKTILPIPLVPCPKYL